MKRCAQCGAENLDFARFCESCGCELPEQVPAPDLQDSASELLNAETPVEVPASEEDPTVEAPKKSRKGLWIGLGCLAGVLVVAAVVICWLFAQNPMKKIAAAAKKTAYAMQQELAPMERLQAVSQTQLGLMEANQYSSHLRYDLNIMSQLEMYLDVASDYDGIEKTADLDLSLGIADAGEIQAQIFAENDQILLAAPQLWDDVFSLRMENLGGRLNELLKEDVFPDDYTPELFGSDKTPGAYGQRFEETCGAALRDYIRSLKPQEVQKIQEADSTWTYYLLVSQPEKKQALLDSFGEFWKESEALLIALPDEENRQEMEDGIDEYMDELAQLEDLQVAVDSRGYLVAVRVTTQEGDVVEGKLTGGESPWSAYSLYYNDEQVLQGSLTVESGVLTCKNRFQIEEEQVELNMVYTDATGAFSFDIGMQEPPILTGTIRQEDGGIYMELLASEQMLRVSASMTPLAQTPSRLEGPQLDVFDLSKEDQERLKEEAMRAFMMDEDLMGLLMWFMGNSSAKPFL